MNITPHPLLTRKQVEDYLIYHCPLLQSTPADVCYMYDTHKYPFLVQFKTSDHDFSSVQKTPWQAYSVLADMVWRDIRALPYITNLYYNS
jgi:hypothetical protein